jgi:hypothetical protein
MKNQSFNIVRYEMTSALKEDAIEVNTALHSLLMFPNAELNVEKRNVSVLWIDYLQVSTVMIFIPTNPTNNEI